MCRDPHETGFGLGFCRCKLQQKKHILHTLPHKVGTTRNTVGLYLRNWLNWQTTYAWSFNQTSNDPDKVHYPSLPGDSP